MLYELACLINDHIDFNYRSPLHSLFGKQNKICSVEIAYKLVMAVVVMVVGRQIVLFKFYNLFLNTEHQQQSALIVKIEKAN